MNFMFSYRCHGGLCGNLCGDNIQEVAVRAHRMLPHIESFSWFKYPTDTSSLLIPLTEVD